MVTYQKSKKNRFFRLKLVLIGLFLGVFVIFLRLYHLQVSEQQHLRLLGKKNCIKTEVILPLRGNFFDAKKVLLATNRPVFDLYWQGQKKPWNTTVCHQTFDKVCAILALSEEKVSLDAIKFAHKHGLKRLIKSDISFDELCKISEQCADLEFLLVKNRFDRIYPYKTLASHLLGYLSRTEKIGCSGLEHVFEQELKGEVGCVNAVTNSVGRELESQMIKPSQPGVDLQLTIDFELQALAESFFEPGQSGSFILMDAETGALRVCLSYPNFDPNMFLGQISEDEWTAAMSENNPLLNRVTRALYPPASIFKLATFAAAIDEGIITPDTQFMCRGYVMFKGRRYYCKRHSGHGSLNITDGLATSCNVPCFEIGKQLHVDTFADYANRFGLGKKTNFLLPEREGLVPTAAWKKKVKGEQWWAGETLSVSIGQSYLLVTPLQIARMTAAVATGNLVKPRVLESESVEVEPLRISSRALHFLRASMNKVAQVDGGTARRLGYLHGFDFCAKTGTAQTCGLEVEKTHRKHREHAWLVSYFRYKQSKPMVIVIMLEHVESSTVAVDLARRFLRSYRSIQEATLQEVI